MQNFETFTIDEDRYNLSEMAEIIKSHHFIPIVEPGILYQKGNAYKKGH